MEAKPVQMCLHFFDSAVIANSKLDYSLRHSWINRGLGLEVDEELLYTRLVLQNGPGKVRIFFIMSSLEMLFRTESCRSLF